MEKQIRKVGAFLMLCFCALFVQLNYVQVYRAHQLNTRPGNSRPVDAAFSRQRGTISTADGVVIARSVPSKDRYQYQREYPQGNLYSQLTGYFNYRFGATGLEQEYNDELAGRTAKQQFRSISDLFVKKDRTGNLTLTIRSDLQALAQKELAGRDGSVVMLNPKTGAVLALYSYPDFDPNLLSQHPRLKNDPSAAAKALLEADSNQPLLARAYRQIFFPGSTFKLITGSIGVQSGHVTETMPSYPFVRAYKPPKSGHYELGNDAGESCGGTLFRILATSCNSAFGQMGVELGPDTMVSGADAFGFNQRPPIDLPAPVASYFPPPATFVDRASSLAQSAIGQFDVKATPLQMALVAAGIANGGKIMVPHVLDEIRDGDGDLIKTLHPVVWKTPISAQTADLMKQAMVSVVTSGTGRGLGLPGVEVGLKTGTAQLGTNPPTSHTWIVGYAGPPGDPQVAIAVIVERQPGDSEATGARVAGPVAKAMLQAALNPPAPQGGSGG